MNFYNTKQCSKCGEVKGLDEFYRRTKSCDGRCSSCIQCSKTPEEMERKRNSLKKHRETHKEKYREKHREYVKAWALKNPEKAYAIRQRRQKSKSFKDYRKKQIENLADFYIKKQIRKEGSVISTALIEAKRERILTTRILRELKGAINEQIENRW